MKKRKNKKNVGNKKLCSLHFIIVCDFLPDFIGVDGFACVCAKRGTKFFVPYVFASECDCFFRVSLLLTVSVIFKE